MQNETQLTSQPPTQHRTRSPRHRRIWLTVTVIAMLIAALATTALGHQRDSSVGGPSGDSPTAVLPDPLPVDKDLNILLMGVDQRPHDVGRSDTLVILHVDTETKRLSLMSIPRDTMVDLPGHGRQKINAAYVWGGVDLMRKTVSELTGLTIAYHVKIDMAGFADVVDALGGVDVDVKQQMVYMDKEANYLFKLDPGLQHLDGRAAMYFVRWRGDPRADLGRVERQQQFLQAIAQQKLTPTILPRLPRLIGEVRNCVETDIPVMKQVGLAMTLFQSYGNGLSAATMPGRAEYIDKVSYVVPDKAKLAEVIASWDKPVTP